MSINLEKNAANDIHIIGKKLNLRDRLFGMKKIIL